MASGHRKRKAASLRLNVLNPAGLTNVPAAEIGNTVNLNNLQNIASFSRGGTSPTFGAGSTTLLNNVISNADSGYSKAGLGGESSVTGVFDGTSMSGTIGLTSTTKHYYFPAFGTTPTDLSSSGVTGPVIVYSPEGPQASYVPYYLGGTQVSSSIKFGAQITGSGTPTHVVLYVGGELTSGDGIEVRKVTDNSVFGGRVMTGSDVVVGALSVTNTTASSTDLSAALYRKAILIPTGSIALGAGMLVVLSSSAKTSTTPVAGVFVAISSGTYGTVP